MINTSNEHMFSALAVKASKVSLFILSAVAATFCLFVVMSKLIANNTSHQVAKEPPVGVTLTSVRDDSKTKPIVKPMPKPPQIKPMPKPTVQPKVSTDQNVDIATDPWTFEMGDTGSQQLTIGGPKNLAALPMVRVPPNYPQKAMAEGIEGWVNLSFSIDPVGKVIDVQVVDAEPKRIFDREARKALRKWKYKPQMVNGKAVVQTNQFVMLEFKLGNS